MSVVALSGTENWNLTSAQREKGAARSRRSTKVKKTLRWKRLSVENLSIFLNNFEDLIGCKYLLFDWLMFWRSRAVVGGIDLIIIRGWRDKTVSLDMGLSNWTMLTVPGTWAWCLGAPLAGWHSGAELIVPISNFFHYTWPNSWYISGYNLGIDVAESGVLYPQQRRTKFPISSFV